MKKVLLTGGLVIIAILLTVGIGMYIRYSNEEVRLREAITAKIEDNTSHYTKMWEIIKTQANVSERYADDFKEIYPDLIKGRYSNGAGQLMSWIQEHNPNFDTSLYMKLMLSIEGQRESFHTTQRQLIDLSRQHNILLKEIPSTWFLSSRDLIDIPVVVNDEAVKAFKTEREQEMELFSD